MRTKPSVKVAEASRRNRRTIQKRSRTGDVSALQPLDAAGAYTSTVQHHSRINRPELHDELCRWLQHQIGALDHNHPIAISQHVELELLILLKRRLLLQIEQLAHRKRTTFVQMPGDIFKFGRDLYQARIGGSPLETFVLEIVIESVMPGQQSELSVLELNIDSVGRFRAIRIHIEPVFRPIEDHLAATAQMIIETGYNWLRVQNAQEICSNASLTDSECISIVRKLFPDERVSDSIKLNALTSDFGRYLIDPRCCDSALRAASARLIATPNSPVEVVSDFFLTVVPYDKTFSKEVFEVQRPLRADFKHAKYSDLGVNLSEINVFNSESIIVHPLVCKDNIKLVAGYPTSLRSVIEGTLERERVEFDRVFEQQASSLVETTSLMEKRSRFERLAETVGALLGSAVAHFVRHSSEGK